MLVPAPATTSRATATKTAHIIKVKEFGTLAAFIAGLGSAIDIPAYFADALSRVISVRKSFAALLASEGVNISPESDATHSFFVEQLEKVQAALAPALKAITATLNATSSHNGTSMAGSRATPATKKNIVNSIFSALKVYYPSTKFENAPNVPHPAPALAKTTYMAEQADSIQDAIFALTVLLNDYADLRAEIRALWTEYTSCNPNGDAAASFSGEFDLAAVSVATNTAFEMARSMEDDITELLDKSGGAHALVLRYCGSLCRASGINMWDKETPRDPYNFAAYDIADVCLVSMLTLFASYAATADRGSGYLQDYNGKFGWYDEKLGSKATTNRQRWQQDMTAVLELMPDLSFMVNRLGRLSVVDELTRGLAYAMEDKNRPTKLWLTFTLQIYVDILQNFVPACESLEKMQAESRRIKHAMIKVPSSDPQRAKVLAAVRRWDTDPIWAARALAVSAGLLPKVRSPPFKFLRRNPVYCGLLVHHMRSVQQMAGLHYAATPGALLGAVQLYNALQSEGLLPDDCAWADLQELWDLQGDASFFVGDPPTTKEGYFNNYSLSIGTSATHFASASSQRKSKQPVKTHKDNRRNLMPIGYVSLCVSDRLEHPGARVPWSPAAVQDILVEGITKRNTDSRSCLHQGAQEQIDKSKRQLAALPPAGLVREVANAVRSEKHGLCFDFFTMHNQVWSLLQALQKALRTIVPTIAHGKPQETLPFVPGICFAAAAGKSLDRSMVVAVNDALLRTAAEVVRAFVEDGEGKAVERARERKVSEKEVASLKAEDPDEWGLEGLGIGRGRAGAGSGSRLPAGLEGIEGLEDMSPIDLLRMLVQSGL